MGLYSETEEAAFEPKAVKATATRQQPQQSRGLSAIAAATNTAPEEEPVDAEIDGDDGRPFAGPDVLNQLGCGRRRQLRPSCPGLQCLGQY